jgi:hypothetical protein
MPGVPSDGELIETEMPSYTAEERAWLQGLIEKEPLRFPSYGKWLGWREHQGEVVD